MPDYSFGFVPSSSLRRGNLDAEASFHKFTSLYLPRDKRGSFEPMNFANTNTTSTLYLCSNAFGAVIYERETLQPTSLVGSFCDLIYMIVNYLLVPSVPGPHLLAPTLSARPMAPDSSTSTSQPDRLFEPRKIWGFDIEPSLVEVDRGNLIHVGCQFSKQCELCGRLTPHIDTLIIAVDGACRSNGRKDSTPQSALGIFVGHNSPHNFQTKIPCVRTNQVAELTAGILGLVVAGKVIRKEGQGELSTVVIKADSEYLVKGMTEWVVKRKMNGWKTAKGGDVVNRRFFEDLLAEVEELEDAGVTVLSWHVRREFNGEADRLANLALDG